METGIPPVALNLTADIEVLQGLFGMTSGLRLESGEDGAPKRNAGTKGGKPGSRGSILIRNSKHVEQVDNFTTTRDIV